MTIRNINRWYYYRVKFKCNHKVSIKFKNSLLILQVMYFASCHSGSMFVQHDEAYKMINVYAIASSNAQQPSYQINNVKELGINLGTQFGLLWMKDRYLFI